MLAVDKLKNHLLVNTRGELPLGRCRQMGIKFVLDVPLRRLRWCESNLTN